MDFDIAALFAALDAERCGRGMSWSALAREISRLFARSGARPISATTLSGLLSKRSVEADGVLQMLRWLGREPESFVPQLSVIAGDGFRLPVVSDHQILRIDTKHLHAALDAQRSARGMTWAQVAGEIGGLNAASLTRLARGGRTSFPEVVRIARWVNSPLARFARGFDH